MSKKGILLINLGTPDSPKRKDVYKYLKEFLLDPRVIDINPISRNLLVRGIIAPFRSKDSAEIYEKVWTENGSPLLYYGEKLRDGVQKVLGDDYIVELGMRYQSPDIKSVLDKLVFEDLVDDITILPLFPQYASASTGSVYEKVMEISKSYLTIPNIKFINSFPDNDTLIDVFSDNARTLGVNNYDHILFSFHGLPVRHLKKSDPTQNHCLKVDDCCSKICDANQFCYSAQCNLTARLIASNLNLSTDQYTVCYQSRLGKDPWVQPYTTDILKERADKGDKSLLVFSPAFVADCLETIVEISDEYHEEFIEMGGEKLDLVPSLNDNPKWINAVAELVS